ncbi:arylsulfatase [Flavobacterium luteum]|uniref:Arylsulfatase n=2 Tax=Flavobacterium luteum TaxID=2026654 RepID=A0A7J5A900_9FLAO|nr:arylsulfatase [Flavobacterium luteum]
MNKSKILALLGVLVLISPALYSQVSKTPTKPNILIILADDMGYSDIGCYGGEIHTPNIDRLAAGGVKFSQMYNTAKCFPTRASLLTGAYYQRTNADFGNTATIGEALRPAGYNTFWSGKQHAKFNPTTRGFDRYYGMIGGCENHFNPGFEAAPGQAVPAYKVAGNRWALDETNTPENNNYIPQDSKFYDTDAFTDRALTWLDEYKNDKKPFLLYMAYTAPHWPLHAWPEDIAKYKGVYDGGYEAVRQARYKRQVQLGLIDPKTSPLPPMEIGETKPKWESLSPDERKLEATRMEVYAAMVDRLDQNIGRLLKHLEEQGKLQNTLVFFLSDNGACAVDPKVDHEDVNAPMGSVASYPSYGQNWATVSDTPLRKWKTTSHEGGISTPLIVNWPAGIQARAEWNQEPVHLIDIMPTVLAVSGAKFPGESKESNIHALDGVSLLPAFKGDKLARKSPLFYQYAKSAAIRDGHWKLVRLGPTWELYNLATDRTETKDLISQQPDIAKKMEVRWLAWWKDCTGSEWTGKAPKEPKDE